jgi:hypothetical protein
MRYILPPTLMDGNGKILGSEAGRVNGQSRVAVIKFTNAMEACNRMFISTTMIAPTEDLLTELECRGPIQPHPMEPASS